MGNGWPSWALEIRQVRLELRKLLDRYPKAFAAVMEAVVASGGDLDSLLPPRQPWREFPVKILPNS